MFQNSNCKFSNRSRITGPVAINMFPAAATSPFSQMLRAITYHAPSSQGLQDLKDLPASNNYPRKELRVVASRHDSSNMVLLLGMSEKQQRQLLTNLA